MSINYKIEDVVTAVHYYSAALCFKLLLVTEAPGYTYTFNLCIAGGLYVNLAVADVNALLCRDSHFVKGLVYIYGRWFALGFNTHSDSFINKTGEIILTKLIHRLVELV